MERVGGKAEFRREKPPAVMFNSDIFFMKIALEKIAKPLAGQFHASTVSDPRKTNIFFSLWLGFAIKSSAFRLGQIYRS